MPLDAPEAATLLANEDDATKTAAKTAVSENFIVVACFVLLDTVSPPLSLLGLCCCFVCFVSQMFPFLTGLQESCDEYLGRIPWAKKAFGPKRRRIAFDRAFGVTSPHAWRCHDIRAWTRNLCD